MMEMVDSFISGKIDLSEQLAASQRMLSFNHRLNSLQLAEDPVTNNQPFKPLLEFLQQYLGAEGALLVLPDESLATGLTPAKQNAFAKVIRTQQEVTVSHDLHAPQWASRLAGDHQIGGLAIVPFQALPGCGLGLTRPARTNTRSWAGKPNTYGEYTLPNGEVILGARRSFELWQETVEHQSEPWPPETLECLTEAAGRIVQHCLKKEYFRARDFARMIGKAVEVMSDFVTVTHARRDLDSG
ncbi:MAG: GAF domain-containing protein [Saccharospirillum sp.]